MTSNLPIVDFAKWHDPNSTAEERQAVASHLVLACRTIGFAYVINHEVPVDQLNGAFKYMEKLFALDEKEKEIAAHPPGSAVHRGYTRPGREEIKSGGIEVKNSRESYDIGSGTNDAQPNIWLPESSLSGFQPFMTSFYENCGKAARSLIQALGMGLELPEEEQEKLLREHSGTNNQLRLAHYLAVPADALQNGDMTRLPTHTDGTSITMVFQDDCGGLKVADPNEADKFIDATPIPNAIVMNIGDLMMRWSNDILKSTPHRVSPLEDRTTGVKRTTRERFSIPYFVSPDDDAVIQCLSSCAGAKKSVKYAPILSKDYRIAYMENVYAKGTPTVDATAA